MPLARHPAAPPANPSPLPSPLATPAVPATLDSITLEAILTVLVSRYGWQELGRRIDIRCFTTDPSIASSLKFLRRTPWAREKVEQLYLQPEKSC